MTDQRRVTLIATTHLDQNVYEKVQNAVDLTEVDHIALELDKRRFQRLQENNAENTSISLFNLLTNKQDIDVRSALLLYLFSKLQSKIGDKYGVEFLGKDQLDGYKIASKYDIDYSLIDRDILKTANRLRDKITLQDQIKIFGMVGLSYLALLRMSDERIENRVDELDEESVDKLREYFPDLADVMITERNQFMYLNLKEIAKSYDNIVVITGAGHVPGLKQLLENDPTFTAVQDVN